MNASDSDESKSSQALDVYLPFAEAQIRGELVDFEALCRANPDIETDLRRLHANLLTIAPMFAALRSSPASMDRIRDRFGSTVDPGIILDKDDEQSPAETIVRGIRGRASAYRRYDVKGEIGRGGMGKILKVYDRDLRRHLAMKAIRTGHDDDEPRSIESVDSGGLSRFLEEAQITSQLDHPGIVPVHELGIDDDGHVYFTMKYVKGRSLSEILDDVAAGRGEWTRDRVLQFVLVRVCEAMTFAHSRDVIHRDLKPSNIMVGKIEHGEVYVMDWGLARVLTRPDTMDARDKVAPTNQRTVIKTDAREGDSSASTEFTVHGQALGTPSYMSPEQAKGRIEEIGPWSDIYSLGATLYVLLTGQIPYVEPGSRLDPLVIVSMVCQAPPTSIHEINPEAPPELIAICEKAMARDIRRRYRTMKEFGDDLRAYLEGRVVQAYRSGAVVELSKWIARNRRFALASVIAIVAILGMITTIALNARIGEREAIAKAELAELRARDASARAELAAVSEREASAKAELIAMREDRLIDEGVRGYELRKLIVEADDLWPVVPQTIPQFESWIQRATELLDYRTDAERRLSEIIATVARDPAEKKALELRQVALEDFIADLGRLESKDPIVSALTSIKTRLEAAQAIRDECYQRVTEWENAIRSIADRAESPRYDGLILEKREDIVPRYRDPVTGLWIFTHLLSGCDLVLIPEARTFLGAQNESTLEPNYDPSADRTVDGPVREVSLAPYCIAISELTREQWGRLSPLIGVFAPTGASTGDLSREPMDSISLSLAHKLLTAAGLAVPTGDEWERAARADTMTPWFFGDALGDLPRFANIADISGSKNPHVRQIGFEETIDDGFETAAPIKSFKPNGFGLFDTIGNLAEWSVEYPLPMHANLSFTGMVANFRGGSYGSVAHKSRVTWKTAIGAESSFFNLGVRPVLRFKPKEYRKK